MRRLRNQSGVAMVTVLLVAAAMTVVASSAAFLTIREFKSGQDDQKAGRSLGIAEAGVDRIIVKLRGNGFGYKPVMRSGCGLSGDGTVALTGDINTGSFRTIITPITMQGAGGCNTAGFVPNPSKTTTVALTSCGIDATLTDQQLIDTCRIPGDVAVSSTPQRVTRRLVRQIVEITPKGLPIGLYADSTFENDGNGSGGKIFTISMITPGDVLGRSKIAMIGNDRYYTKGDFYPGALSAAEAAQPIPSSVHAGGTIYLGSNTNSTVEHPPILNCTANPTTGGADPRQAAWDGSSAGNVVPAASTCGGTLGKPPTTLFSATEANALITKQDLTPQDYAALKATAQASGVYCNLDANGNGTCTKNGAAYNTNQETDIDDAMMAGMGNTPVLFWDFPTSGDPFDNKRIITFKANAGWTPCSSGKLATIIVRQGSFGMTGNANLVAAIIAKQGEIELGGTGKFEGTVLANRVHLHGSGDIELSQCAIDNISFIFLDVTPTRWNEVDR